MKGSLMLQEHVTTAERIAPARPAVEPVRRRRNIAAYAAVLGAALLTGLLLPLCWFPMSWGGLAWIALVPLLFLTRTRVHPLWVYFCAWVSGSAFFWMVLSWMPACNEQMGYAWYGVSLACSLFVVAALWLTRALRRRTALPLVLVLPLVWVGLDFVRSIVGTGFPWYYLGHTQHIFLPICQVADLGGAYLVTFLVVMVNALVFEWLYLNPRFWDLFYLEVPPPEQAVRMVPRCVRLSFAVGVILIAALGYGVYRMNEGGLEAGPRLAMLNGNIAQNIRNAATAEQQQGGGKGSARRQMLAEYTSLCISSREKVGLRVDLVVWPETSFPGEWFETDPDLPMEWEDRDWMEEYRLSRDYMRFVAQRLCQANTLIGLNSFYRRLEGNKAIDLQYNSALLVRDNGTIGGRYDKIHRLPFGEYMPSLQKHLPFLRAFSPYEGMEYGVQPGKDLRRFQLGQHSFGVLICYEDSDPVLARQYGAARTDQFTLDPLCWLERLRRYLDGIHMEPGPPVDFLVNISNDGWYAGTSEHNEHLAISRFRAIETRRSLARAVNMGISALIDSNGRVLEPQLLEYEKRKEPGTYTYFWNVADGETANLPVARWNEFKKVSGVLTGIIPIDHRTSLYSVWGDWLPYGCWAIMGAGLVGVLRRRKKDLPLSSTLARKAATK
jgi:apolipoprotein N-acyltransferase